VREIQKCTGLADEDATTIMNMNAGVCKKCYRTVESTLAADAKIQSVKQTFREKALNVVKTNVLQLPSPRRKTVSKRMLRSPDRSDMPSSKQTHFDVSYVKLVKMEPFADLTNIAKPKRIEVRFTFVEFK
jgi:hypothetical protein